MAYYDEVMADSPTGYWRLDEFAGGAGIVDHAVVDDSSGNGHDGELRIVSSLAQAAESLVAGSPGASLYLEGASVQIPSLGPFSTFSAEFITLAHDGEWRAGFGATNVWGLDVWNQPTVTGSSNGQLMMLGPEDDSSGSTDITTRRDTFTGMVPERWERFHCVGTYDGSYLRFYGNGVLISSYNMADNPWPALVDGGGPPYIETDTTRNFQIHGIRVQMDEVAFYKNAVLSPARIAAHYAALSIDFRHLSSTQRWTNTATMQAEGQIGHAPSAQTARWTSTGGLTRDDAVAVQYADGHSLVTGDLNNFGPEDLGGDSIGRTSVSGNLGIRQKVAGSSAGRSSVSALIGSPAGVVGSAIDGQSYVSGTLDILAIAPLQGISHGSSSIDSYEAFLSIKSKPRPSGGQDNDQSDPPDGFGGTRGGGKAFFSPYSSGRVTEDCT